MIKRSTIYSFTIVVFFICTLSNAQFNKTYDVGDAFGYPFVFFSAKNGTETIFDKTFSMGYLLTDIAVCFLIACVGTYVMSKLRIKRGSYNVQGNKKDSL